MNQQGFDQALPHFQRALELNPKSFQVCILRGESFGVSPPMEGGG